MVTAINQQAVRALDKVLAERRQQDLKWGIQDHQPFAWLTILGEEFGESCQAALRARFGGRPIEEYEREVVQVAAVAVAMLECLYRANGRGEVDYGSR